MQPAADLPEPLRPAADAIVAALERALATHRFGDPQIREAVHAFARAARDARVPPERVIVLLKGVILHETLRTMNEWFLGVTVDRAVSWAIQEYFSIDDRLQR